MQYPRNRKLRCAGSHIGTDGRKIRGRADCGNDLRSFLAIEIEQGAAFDVQKDFTGLGLKDGDKAELKKAAMEDGTNFDPARPGTYKCVYRITPKEGILIWLPGPSR